MRALLVGAAEGVRAPVGRALSRIVDPLLLGSFDRTGFRIHSLAVAARDLDVDLAGRRRLVMGANSGIGFETSVAGADTVAWLAASRRARRFTGRFFFDREARHTHWLPTTRESRAERQAFWRLCEIATAGAPAEVVPISGRV